MRSRGRARSLRRRKSSRCSGSETADAPERGTSSCSRFWGRGRPMRALLKRLVSEPGAESAEDYARRVRLLAATYAILFSASVAGAVVLAWHGKLFVTLTQ